MKKRYPVPAILLTVIGWVLFILFPLVLNPAVTIPNPSHLFFNLQWMVVVFNILLVGFYYLNSLVLMPHYLKRNLRLTYLLAVTISFFVIIIFTLIITRNIYLYDKSSPPEFAVIRYLISLLIFMFVLLYNIGSTFFSEWHAAERRNEVMLFEKTAAELSFLKSQINPHFLFNTLNNIYTLSFRDPEQSAVSILKLSHIMRYVLQESMNEMVELNKEVEYISQYIDLQKIRLTDHVKVIFLPQGNSWNVSVFPLLFLPFIENAFKYGVSTHEPSEIKIDIISNVQELILKVQNTIVKNTIPAHEVNGVGLVNVKRRLDLLYPGKHVLKIDEKNNKFVVELKIIL